MAGKTSKTDWMEGNKTYKSGDPTANPEEGRYMWDEATTNWVKERE